MKKEVFLLLGSNQDDPRLQLAKARAEIILSAGSIKGISSVYKTAPWGIANQPEFYNQVISIETLKGPVELIKTIQSIEKNMGRKREEKWGPRIIDIDILFYEDKIINTEDLIIPHPGIPVRRFTLEPLNELAPDFIHPILGKTIAHILSECEDSLAVEKAGDSLAR